MSEEELRQLLREMRDDPIPADSLARVRIGAGERIGNRRRWWLLPALALPVSVAVLVIAILHPVQQPHTNLNVMVRKLEPGVTTEPQRTETRVVRAANRAVGRRSVRSRGTFGKRSPAISSPTLIRIETPDPNVLILLVEEK